MKRPSIMPSRSAPRGAPSFVKNPLRVTDMAALLASYGITGLGPETMWNVRILLPCSQGRQRQLVADSATDRSESATSSFSADVALQRPWPHLGAVNDA